MTGSKAFLGVGPKLAFVTLLAAAPLVAAHYCCGPRLKIVSVPAWVSSLMGGGLLVGGIVYYVAGLRALLRARGQKRLATTGVYSICRHPVYSSWIFLIVPGAIVLLRMWILLVLPFVAYGALRVFVREEETELEGSFGPEYRAYKRRVNLMFPTLGRRRIHIED